MPNSRRGGISIDIAGEMKWGGNLIEESFVGEADRRMGEYRSENDGIVTTKQAIRPHMGCRWGEVEK